MSSWLCSSGSRPISFSNSRYRLGWLPDEHNQLDILYMCSSSIQRRCGNNHPWFGYFSFKWVWMATISCGLVVSYRLAAPIFCICCDLFNDVKSTRGSLSTWFVDAAALFRQFVFSKSLQEKSKSSNLLRKTKFLAGWW